MSCSNADCLSIVATENASELLKLKLSFCAFNYVCVCVWMGGRERKEGSKEEGGGKERGDECDSARAYLPYTFLLQLQQ